MWDKIKEQWASFLEKWAIFFAIILDPITLILLLGVFFLIWFSKAEEQNKLLMNILIVIISITSGVLGALISSRWSEITETKLIRTRGKLAIRNLGLLLLNLRSLEKRVSLYLEKLQDTIEGNKLIRNYFEETIEKCNVLEEEVINSIENWKDIIPEADLTTQIGVISELKETQSNLTFDLKNLKDKQEKTKEESIKEKEELIKKIASKEKELASVKSKLQEKEIQVYPYFSSTGLSGYSGISEKISNYTITKDNNSIYKLMKFKKTCSKCGKPYRPSTHEEATELICPDCKKKLEESPGN